VTPLTAAVAAYEPAVPFAVRTGAVATPSGPDTELAVPPLAAKLPPAPPAPPVETVKVTVVPLTGWPPASVTFAARFTAKAVLTAALCGVEPLSAATAAGGLIGAAVSSTNCGAFAPVSRLAYFFSDVDVAFISKL